MAGYEKQMVYGIFKDRGNGQMDPCKQSSFGDKCLFLSGERRDESRGRARLPEIEYHSTTLWKERRFYLPLVQTVP